MKQFIVILIAFFLIGCSSKSVPVMDQKSARETFQPILAFMEYKPGMSFADVGAGSGAISISMASLMDSSVIYIQDIDTSTLNQGNLNKFLDYYAKEFGKDLRKSNEFHITIGEVDRTNLPNATFDRIYSNATVHNFTEIDSIMIDLKRKLKPGGIIFFRDSFKGDHNEGEFCSDPKCARKLLTIDEFLAIMDRNGFTMIKKAPDMSGYPVFGFSASR